MRETLSLVLFACFFAGTLIQITIMLGRKRQGMGLDRFRLFFFFMASLMLICLLPLSIFSKLSPAVWVSDLTVVLANLIGLLLTYTWERRGGKGGTGGREGDEEVAVGQSVRAYVVYYQGKQLGMITREGFEQMLKNDLLKKQRTVELIDDYQEKAQKHGLKVLIYQNKEGSQRLVKVEGPNLPLT